MSKFWVQRLLLGVALMVLIVVNMLVLGHVRHNRREPAVARLWLSERELPNTMLKFLRDSGVHLQIRWRNLARTTTGVDDQSPAWLDEQKLTDLGFHPMYGMTPRDYRAKLPLDREVFMVLEYNGAAFTEAIRRASQAVVKSASVPPAGTTDPGNTADQFAQSKERMLDETRDASRLFVVDAGLDPQQLQQMYHDSGKYIITRGVIGVEYVLEKGKLWPRGVLKFLHSWQLAVPLSLRKPLDHLLMQERDDETGEHLPQYQVQVVYGQDFDPWIEDIRVTGN